MLPRLNKLGGVYGETLRNAAKWCANVKFDGYRYGLLAGGFLNCRL